MKNKILCFILLFLGALGTRGIAQKFVEKTTASGLDHSVHTNGVSVADYDLDGDLDVFFVATAQYDSTDTTTFNRFYRNNGDGTFTDITVQSGLRQEISGRPFGGMGNKFGAAWGDYDNDGYPDLCLTNIGPEKLFHNNGDGTFTDVTATAGIAGTGNDTDTSVMWWDYNQDGYLDLYISAWIGQNRMYKNLGNGTFQDVTLQAGLVDTSRTWTAIPIDGNNDGIPDLYEVNDYMPNRFLIHRGDGTFVDSTAAYGLGDPGNGMGVTVGDYNNDSYFDIYLTNISSAFLCPLYTNTGHGSFVDENIQMGVGDTGWAWGTEFFDYDNDGDLDLYAANGNVIEYGNNFLFANRLEETGTVSFEDVSAISGADGSNEARGLVVFDYDNDGDLDLLVANWWKPPYLYENQSVTGNWLKVNLQGTTSNRTAYGAILRVTANGKSFYRQYDGVDFLGQSVQPIHFGLGNINTVDELSVRWPNGVEEIYQNIPVNQTISLTEGAGTVTAIHLPQNNSVEKTFQLRDNYPNPFNGGTTIQFNLPATGPVKLAIFNSLGQRIRSETISSGKPGINKFRWDGKDARGRDVSSGYYFYQVTFRNSSKTGKMLYMK